MAVAEQVLEDILADVMTSATIDPSVPAVVFEVVTEIVSSGDLGGQEEEAEKQDENVGQVEKGPPRTVQQEEVRKDTTELEVQEVKVQVKEDREEKKAESKVITFGGKSVPESGVVIINGYAKAVQDQPVSEKAAVSQPPAPKPHSNSIPSRQQSAIPQTDLDTFETRVTPQQKSAQDAETSNLEDDVSDKKSDSGSVNTLDSVDKESALGENNTAVVGRRRGHLRPRNVRYSVGSWWWGWWWCVFVCVCVCVRM